MKTLTAKALSALFLVLLSEAAMAACTRIYTQLNSSIGTVTVEDKVAVGSPLTPGWASGSPPTASWSCTPNSHYAPYIQGAAGEVSRYVEGGQTHSVYPTGVNGVGIVLSAEPARRRGVQQGVEKALIAAISTEARHAYTVQYKLIKTGTISSGGSVNRHVADTWMISRGSEQFPIYVSGTINARIPTCDIAAGDLNRLIQLDPVRLSNFTGTWLGKKTFDISADCSNASNVTFRFTGTPASGNSALFASTGDARGVGLWLYSRIGGVESTLSHNGTRTVAVSGNRAVLPLGAAYHKTTGALTKGSLASAVTVNITYN